ncbi:MAG: histidine kinase, partial [Bacteroidales bacterium]
NNYINYIQGDSVYQHPSSNSSNTLGGFTNYAQQIRFYPDGSLDLCLNQPGLYHLTPGKGVDTLDSHRQQYPDATVFIRYDPTGRSIWDMYPNPNPDPDAPSSVVMTEGGFYLTCGILPMTNSYRKDLHPIGPREFLFSCGHKVFHILENQIIDELVLNEEIIDIFVDDEGDFWVGTMHRGVLRYPGGSLKARPNRYLENAAVTEIRQDHEGNYWFSTANHGIYLVRSLYTTVYSPQSTNDTEMQITSLASFGKNLYFGSLYGQLFKASPMPNGTYRVEEIPIPASSGSIRRIVVTSDSLLYLFKNSLLVIDSTGKPAGFKEYHSFGYDLVPFPRNGYLISFLNWGEIVWKNRMVGRITNDLVRQYFKGEDLNEKMINRVRVMLLDSKWRLWLGSHDAGVFSVTNGHVYSWAQKDTLLGLRTRDIIEVGEDIWFCTSDYGIVVLHSDSTTSHISVKTQSLSHDLVDVLFAENDSTVWAGTSGGVNRIQIRHNTEDPYQVDWFTHHEGFPANRVYDITSHQGELWVASSRGAVRLDPRFQKFGYIKPFLFIENIEVNGVAHQPEEKIRLKPNENHLIFKYKAVTYRSRGSIRYWYRLDGVDKEWNPTNNVEARYPELRPGDYTFRVVASYGADFNEEDVRIQKFHIAKYWFETRVFLAFLIILTLGTVALLIMMRFNNLKRREREKFRMLEAEKRALLAQMNPHFIFNSMNSIQHFIINRDDFNANNYLTNFSSLIRKILDNTQKSVVTLAEEIETLTLYLEMEKLRFEEQFEYKIQRDPSLDHNLLMMPPMLLQPLVENAIWHGLIPLKSKGLLTISFTRTPTQFICEIRDNGIGREKAAELRKKRDSHKSTGMDNVRERIDLLNRMNTGKFELRVVDLKNKDGSAAGTSVIVKVPQFLDAYGTSG